MLAKKDPELAKAYELEPGSISSTALDPLCDACLQLARSQY